MVVLALIPLTMVMILYESKVLVVCFLCFCPTDEWRSVLAYQSSSFRLCILFVVCLSEIKVAQILYSIYILWFHIYTQKWVYPLTLVSTKMMIAFRLKYTWWLVPTQYSVHVQLCGSWICEKVVRPKADLPDGLLQPILIIPRLVHGHPPTSLGTRLAIAMHNKPDNQEY